MDPIRNFRSISRSRSDSTDVSAPKAAFSPSTVISFLFTVRQSHWVRLVHTLALKQICDRKENAVLNLQDRQLSLSIYYRSMIGT